MANNEFKGKIIWSADKRSLPELCQIVSSSQFPREQVAVKLDRLFFMKYGLDSIGRIQSLGVAVFADAKIVEIPSKTLEIAKIYLEQRPWMLNVMGNIASTGYSAATAHPEDDKEYDVDALAQFADLCAEAGTKSCVVTVLTSKTPRLIEMEFGKDADSAVQDYARLAAECGITDLVCSPREVPFLKSMKLDCELNTPGIQCATSNNQDQQRTLTPAAALLAGSDRLVIGRDLSDGDFFENYAKITEQIAQWVN